MRVNPNAVVFIAFTTVLGVLLGPGALVGLAVGLGIVLAATFLG